MRGMSVSIWKNLSWKMRINNLFWLHKIYAPISYVINNQAIDFKPCCTQSQTCSTGKSIQMRGASASIWKSLSRKIRRNKFIFYTSRLCSYMHRAWLQRHSMSVLKEAVRELLQCIIMGLSYKNVYYQ